MASIFSFPEFPEYYKSLSRRLGHVLEDIGASTAMRDEHVKASTAEEILRKFSGTFLYEYEDEDADIATIMARMKTGFYRVGSAFEGTTTLSMKSDQDLLMVDEEQNVVTDLLTAQEYSHCFLIVQDLPTPPGYAKLQLVIDGEPQFVPLGDDDDSIPKDNQGRVVYLNPINFPTDHAVVHGPAITIGGDGTKVEHDFVFAVRCPKVPDCASEWFTRQRHHNWPAADCIEKCKTLGCFLVHVGHPNSEERMLQWRMSFSLQERLLISSFNSAQLQCYVLLKIIKKGIIRPFVVEESLTSYHCKTCMLYMIENTPANFWRDDNLLPCLFTCLNMIQKWVESGVCPNYFIPDENMFEGKIFGKKRIRLHEVLSRLLAADFGFLVALESDDIGGRLQKAIVSGVYRDEDLSSRRTVSKTNIQIRLMHTILSSRSLSLQWSQKGQLTASATCKRLHKLASALERIQIMTEHTQKDTRYALSFLSSYVEISLMSVLTVIEQQYHKSNEYIFKLLTSEKWHKISEESDSFSSKLKQASLLYMLGFYAVSLDILSCLEGKLQHQMGFCSCSREHRISFDLDVFLTVKPVSMKEFLKCLLPCVVYISAETPLVPTALRYELNEPIDDIESHDPGFAVVDGKILLYFLLYLNHCRLDMEADAIADADNIWRLLATDHGLGHIKTALNILGWIYKERGIKREAKECFRRSLSLQPERNAASLHMRDLERVVAFPQN